MINLIHLKEEGGKNNGRRKNRHRGFCGRVSGIMGTRQLLEYCKDNLYEFYRKHKESLKNDYKLFMEDQEAHHVQGY